MESRVSAHSLRATCVRSAQIPGFPRSSKPLSSCAAHKFLHRCHRGDRGDRRGAVALRGAYTKRQRPGFRAGASSSMHPPPTLAMRPTGKAVLALEVRSRTPHGHAPWTLSCALTANLYVLSCDKLCPERPCGCRASFISIITHPNP